MHLCSNDCVNKHAYEMLDETVGSFQADDEELQRKTENDSTPYDVMERAAKLRRDEK
jgi:hypothetical protein